ncbi:MAG: hypothetical protein ACREFK_20400 [Stellaceae bacterium]
MMRRLIDRQDRFCAEAGAVLHAGLAGAAWITVEGTGARHRAANGFCTHIGNDRFAWFGTTGSKSQLNFLELLRAGHHDYVINAEALGCMRRRALTGPVIQQLAGHEDKCFADAAAWQAHLDRLGLAALTATPDPAQIVTKGALWGSTKAHGRIADTVILSDDAGQFALGRHALCRVHAEGLVHKLDTFTDPRGPAPGAQPHRVVLCRPQGLLPRPHGPPPPRMARPL